MACGRRVGLLLGLRAARPASGLRCSAALLADRGRLPLGGRPHGLGLERRRLDQPAARSPRTRSRTASASSRAAASSCSVSVRARSVSSAASCSAWPRRASSSAQLRLPDLGRAPRSTVSRSRSSSAWVCSVSWSASRAARRVTSRACSSAIRRISWARPPRPVKSSWSASLIGVGQARPQLGVLGRSGRALAVAACRARPGSVRANAVDGVAVVAAADESGKRSADRTRFRLVGMWSRACSQTCARMIHPEYPIRLSPASAPVATNSRRADETRLR